MAEAHHQAMEDGAERRGNHDHDGVERHINDDLDGHAVAARRVNSGHRRRGGPPRYQRLHAQRRQHGQRQRIPSLHRVQHHALRNRNMDAHDFVPRYPLGTTVCMTDSIFYQNYEQEIDLRYDGTVIGYERVHANPDNPLDSIVNHPVEQLHQLDEEEVDRPPNKYEWRYLIRFVNHPHVFEAQEDTADDHQQPPRTFLKLYTEQDVTDCLSTKDISYTIDQYFGRDLREMIQVSGGLVRNPAITKAWHEVDWDGLLEEILAPASEYCQHGSEQLPSGINIARARFPLYDPRGHTIGDFTILSMVLLILLLRDDTEKPTTTTRKSSSSSSSRALDTTTIIQQLVSVYPKAVEQGYYHDPTQHYKNGSKYLGILQFVLDYDTYEDQAVVYHDVAYATEDPDDPTTTRPSYFATRIDPAILNVLLTTTTTTTTASPRTLQEEWHLPLGEVPPPLPPGTDTANFGTNSGQYLCTDYCLTRQNVLPIHRCMYSAWVTSRHRTRQHRHYLAAATEEGGGSGGSGGSATLHPMDTIDEWLLATSHSIDAEGFEIDATVLSPQVQMILRHNWTTVAFLLAEHHVGTMRYSREVLQFLLYDCLENTSPSKNMAVGNATENHTRRDSEATTGTEHTTRQKRAHGTWMQTDVDNIGLVTVDRVFNGYIHKGGGGIVKWFTDFCNITVPNSLITLLFKHATLQNQNVFHACLKVYTARDQPQYRTLLVPPILPIITYTVAQEIVPPKANNSNHQDEKEEAETKEDGENDEEASATKHMMNHYKLVSSISPTAMQVLKESMFPLPTASTITIAQSVSDGNGRTQSLLEQDYDSDDTALLAGNKEEDHTASAAASTGSQQIHDTTDPIELLETVLVALAIVQRNMVAMPYLSSPKKPGRRDKKTQQPKKIIIRTNDVLIKHSKIIGNLWETYYKVFWTIGGGGSNSHPRPRRYHQLPTMNRSHSNRKTGHPHHPLYTAICRNHPYRPIIRDILALDKSILNCNNSRSNTNNDTSSLSPRTTSAVATTTSTTRTPLLLTPFAYAATKYCSNALTEPVMPPPPPHNPVHVHNDTVLPEDINDIFIDHNVNAIERIYELLRSNPAAIVQQQDAVVAFTAAAMQASQLAVAAAAGTSCQESSSAISKQGGKRKFKILTAQAGKTEYQEEGLTTVEEETEEENKKLQQPSKRRKQNSLVNAITPNGKR